LLCLRWLLHIVDVYRVNETKHNDYLSLLSLAKEGKRSKCFIT